MARKAMNDFRELEKSVHWFRGLSEKQICGCNKLMHALRDDIEQESTYRVRECLLLIGLQPIVNSKQIKVIIEISQGSDLAFLWFLWEAYYKESPSLEVEPNVYTSNEQLILTAIAHLDMVSTMRGLDGILPTAEHSKKHQELESARQQKLDRRRNQQEMKLSKNPGNRLPYFASLVRPKIFVPIAPSGKPKERKVSFPTYDNYKDPLFMIPDESSRWFAAYEMSPAKREVKRCLSDALAQLFGDSRVAPGNVLCGVHRMVERSTERKQEELTVETVRRCMNLLDFEGVRQKKRADRIVCQLEREVMQAAEKLHFYRWRQLTQLQKISGGANSGCKDCQMCVQLMSTPALPGAGDGPRRRTDFTLLLSANDNLPGHPLPDAAEHGIQVLQWGAEMQHKTIHLTKEQGWDRPLPGTGQKAHCVGNAKMPPICKSHCKDEGRIKVLSEDGVVVRTINPAELAVLPPECCPSESSEPKYCSRRTLLNGRLDWNFYQIFQPPPPPDLNEMPLDARQLIRSYCLEALRITNESTEEAAAKKILGKNNVERVQCMQLVTSQLALEAAGKCAVQLFRDAHQKRVTLEAADSEPIQDQLMNGMTSIDPENREQLIELLKSGIDILKKNPRYVLVTLPNAHKLPVLLDWVADRYGKTFSCQQMHELAKTSYFIYEQLFKKSTTPKLPKLKTLYSFEEMRECFYRHLNESALEESRLLWLALRGYSNLSGSQLNTFYAYLPAKKQDILRHNLWQSSDYRPIASMRQRRKNANKL